MFIKPAPGIKVRDPNSKLHIPETGVEVSATDTYWARRLIDGDVVEVQAAPSPVLKISPKVKE
jgi:hypothetical protein